MHFLILNLPETVALYRVAVEVLRCNAEGNDLREVVVGHVFRVFQEISLCVDEAYFDVSKISWREFLFPAALVIKNRGANSMCAVIMHAVRCNIVGESPVAFKVIRANDFHHLAVSVSGDAGMVKGNHDEVARAVRGGVIYRIPADAVFIDNFDFALFFIQIHAVEVNQCLFAFLPDGGVGMGVVYDFRSSAGGTVRLDGGEGESGKRRILSLKKL